VDAGRQTTGFCQSSADPLICTSLYTDGFAGRAQKMRVIRGLHNLRPEQDGCVATIGNFDGVHLGHQAVFRELLAEGQRMGLSSTVMIFEPQPMEYFAPDSAPSRLTRLREKLSVMKAHGIERVLLLEFGPKLAAMSAQDFIDTLLVDKLAVRHLYVGDDFRFGKGRVGDIALLRSAGAQHGFTVDAMGTLLHEGERVSSTRIRQALAEGDLAGARQRLGRPYRICGRVAHGDKRGRTIGFPTMNINLRRRISPLRGVFAVRVDGLGSELLNGVANLGVRPTVGGDARYVLEVHLFDFDRSVYGAHVNVEFIARIRDEKKFESFDDLRQQIAQDAQAARNLLRQ
jgi:riboflavin kinase / FMN adenylyltransferase